MRNLHILKILSLLLILTACNLAAQSVPISTNKVPVPSNPESTPTIPEASTPTLVSTPDELAKWDWMFNAPADPINLKIDLDTSRAVEATISPAGGKLEASGADGTQYILDLPANSVVMDTLIRMTPVKTVSGLPLKQSSTAWAVQLEPEGLLLLANASLIIQFPTPPPVIQQIPFQYQDDGQAFNLATPIVNLEVDTGIDATGIQLDIAHFSGYGMATGYMAELEPVRQRLGGAFEDRYNAEIARLLAIERQKMLLGASDEGVDVTDSPTLTKLGDEFYQQVILPRIEAAKTSCAAGQLVLQMIIKMNRQKQLLGTIGGSDTVEAPFPLPEGFALMVTRRCIQEEYELCRDQHVITRMLPLIVGLMRQIALLGGDVDMGSLDPEILQLAQKCLTFELEFSSTGIDIGNFPGAEIRETTKVLAKIPIQAHLDNLLLMEGTGVLEVGNYTVEITPGDFCKIIDKQSTNGQMTVSSLSFIGSTTEKEYEFPKIAGVEMLVSLYGINQKWSDECKKNGALYWAYTGDWGLAYLKAFGILHRPESFQYIDPPGIPSSFLFNQWKIGGGELFASMEWQKSGADDTGGMDSYIESGTFKLYHRPK
jgi:hypothetical protein